jgi:hypothetical protein
MHKLIEAAGRRTAGLAAGVILTGGMVGGVLLTPGTAYADPVPGATTVTLSATSDFGGINAQVQVSPAPTQQSGSSSFTVSGSDTGGSSVSCGGTVSTSGNGNCHMSNVAAGTYTLTATNGSASSNSVSVTVGNSNPNPNPNPNPKPNPNQTPTSPPTTGNDAPQWITDSPSTSVDSDSYSATFQADNSPSYELSGAPSWLSIDSNGLVSGDIPDGVTSFTYRVGAWNRSGWVWAGPFTVYCHHRVYNYANIQTSLYCTSPVFTGQHGTCTLAVTNWGQGTASDVTAQITLPWPLRADYCGYSYWFGYGCSIYGNTATEDLGSLSPGQWKHLTVTFTAETGFSIWGWHRGHRLTVEVFGSASAGGNFSWYYGHRESTSAAWVTIIPRGHWW